MLAFAFFAVFFVVSLIALIIYLYPSSKNASTIPGLTPLSKEDGNFGDIAKAGSLHEFLVDLHKQYGPIASFWFGPTFTVSIADAKAFKEHMNVFDRPPVLFKLFEPFIGPKSIQYANGSDGRARRNLYDKCLTHGAVKKYFLMFQQVADEMSTKWETLLDEQHVPLTRYMSTFALKANLIALFGEQMSDEVVLKFRSVYDVVWSEMEHRLTEPPTPAREAALKKGVKQLKIVCEDMVARRKKIPTEHADEYLLDLILDMTDDEEQQFSDTISYVVGGFHTTGNSVNELATVCKAMVARRKKIPSEHAEEYLLDLILDLTEDEEQQFSDTITYVVGGFHTTGNMLSWMFYFLATHPDVQEKLFKEIKKVLGDDTVDSTNLADLHYLRQVQDETMRCAVLAPWAARFQDFDSELCGHKIPKNTPVIHALGVSLVDEEVWPQPNKFDPDRFSPKNSTGRPHLAYSPFGFAGKRVCPGQRFVYAEASVAMVTLLKKFKVTAVEGQMIERVHGLVTHPSDEIWITLAKR